MTIQSTYGECRLCGGKIYPDNILHKTGSVGMSTTVGICRCLQEKPHSESTLMIAANSTSGGYTSGTDLPTDSTLTHKDLVDIAYTWVLRNGGCGVAFRELNSVSEIPDVIGFGGWCRSVLIECKANKSILPRLCRRLSALYINRISDC